MRSACLVTDSQTYLSASPTQKTLSRGNRKVLPRRQIQRSAAQFVTAVYGPYTNEKAACAWICAVCGVLYKYSNDHFWMEPHMTTLAQLQAQKAALEAQIEAAQKAQVAEGINKAKAIIAEYSLTKEDVFGASAKRGRKTKGESKVVPKYKDPSSGATWTGRGKAPKWIDGKDRSQYLV